MEKKFERISSWWNQQYRGRPLLNVMAAVKDIGNENLNRFWPAVNTAPDIESLVRGQVRNLHLADRTFLAESYPSLDHSWGSRGTPMTMAAYLGGKVNFGENTVWIDPVIDNWQDFRIVFDENNYWVRQSRKLIECQLRECSGNLLLWLPDFGDALTVFSLLRGVENLLTDLIEIPGIIKDRIEDFVEAWIDAHSFFHSLYRQVLPGDCCWLLWAPGKTYVCQCDFSTMISPSMFEEFVVPEIRALGKYLDYMSRNSDIRKQVFQRIDITAFTTFFFQ